MSKYKLKSITIFATLFISLIILMIFIDFLGVNIIRYNGLIFFLHCYSYGLTFYIASILFAFTFKKVGIVKSTLSAILLGVVTGAIWWGVVFILLMSGIHGLVGGSY